MTTDTQGQPGDEVLPKEGDIVAGKYRVVRTLGRGGMGLVVAAEHVSLRQPVAMKFLLPEAIARPGATERFLREAKAAVTIQSEHIARVQDVGTLESGAPYMVMELLNGADLGVYLDENGPLPIVDAVDYILQACEAIAEAHSIGIIHRDLKPANLFLSTRPDGSSLVKVLDFGLSKPPKIDQMDASLTAAGVIMGSPFYMSPEQIRGLKGVDARTDIWALGVILYHLIAGVRPFESDALGALFLMIGADTPVSLKDRRPDVPAELDAVVMRCLAKDLPARVQSVAELARGLEPFGSPECRASVERIVRLLPGAAPPPRSSFDGEVSGPPQPALPVARESAVPADSRRTGTSPSQPPPPLAAAMPSWRPPPNATVPISAPVLPSAPAPVDPHAAIPPGSGSMQAVTSSLGGPTASSPSLPVAAPAPPARSSRTLVIAAAAIVALGAGGFLGLRMLVGKAPPPPAPAQESAPPPAASPAPSPAPSAPATAEAPSATATAVEAPSAVPAATATATASAAPSGSSKAVKPRGPSKKKDPLDRWR